MGRRTELDAHACGETLSDGACVLTMRSLEAMSDAKKRTSHARKHAPRQYGLKTNALRAEDLRAFDRGERNVTVRRRMWLRASVHDGREQSWRAVWVALRRESGPG